MTLDTRPLPLDDSCIVVFTSRTVDEMVAAGGSQAWKLGTAARKCRYLVCTWNSSGDHAQPNQGLSHGEAFLVAPISAIEPAPLPEDPSRSIIRFTEFARTAIPSAWRGQRNPVAYSTISSLREMGIDLDMAKCVFRPVPQPRRLSAAAARPGGPPLTIAQAKEALAATYGVQPHSIEITIRG
jgi:hypothetical protein